MPIFGLALTLRSDADTVERTVSVLASDPRVELGEHTGWRLPLVLETQGPHDVQRFIEALLEAGDVLQVDVAFAHFEDLHSSVAAEERRRGPEA